MFEKLVLLVGFTIEIHVYYDARPYKLHILCVFALRK
jgi:hypothetical protein